MSEEDIIVISCYPNKKKKAQNSPYKSALSPSVFNKNNSIFIINDKLEKNKFGKKLSFSQIVKKNKTILKYLEKDNLNISGASIQTLYEIVNKENSENNELLSDMISLIEKDAFEKKSSEKESESNPNSGSKIYIIKNYNEIINQLYTKEKYIKELNKKLAEKDERIKKLEKEKDRLYDIIENINRNNVIFNKYKELEKENKQLKDALLLKEDKKELNENIQNNKILINKNKNKEQKDLEIEKLINEMRENFRLGEEYNDEILRESLIKNDLDTEKAFSQLFI